MIYYLLFPVGFVLLIKGAEYLIRASVSVARRFQISEMIVGLTIIAMGTSLPEMVVNIIASVNNKGDIVFSNILGSNIANILLVLGICSIVKPIQAQISSIKKELPISFLIILVLYLFLYGFHLPSSQQEFVLFSKYGYFLLIGFLVYLIYIFYQSKKKIEVEEEELEIKNLGSIILIIVVSISSIALGGKFIVDGAIHFATLWGISEKFIALSIVAVGTSLPELVTSLVAIKQKKTDFIIGGIIGSNIFNVLWVLGLSSSIRNIHTTNPLLDIMVAFSSAFLLFLFLLIHKKNKINFLVGSLFLLLYFSYIFVSYSI